MAYGLSEGHQRALCANCQGRGANHPGGSRDFREGMRESEEDCRRDGVNLITFSVPNWFDLIIFLKHTNNI